MWSNLARNPRFEDERSSRSLPQPFDLLSLRLALTYPPTSTCRVACIGGGLAGLLLARALVTKGVPAHEIVILDARDPTRGSDNPGAMMHPFAGRQLKPKTGVLDAFRASADLLDAEVLGDETIPSFRGPMIRPLLPNDTGEAFATSWEDHRDAYPAWLPSARIPRARVEALGPFAHDFEEAIAYRPAYAVSLAGWLDALGEKLRRRGVRLLPLRAEAIRRRPRSWQILGTEGRLAAQHCVLACGAQMTQWFPRLKLQPTAGALLVVEAAPAELRAAVSAGGHVAPLSDGTWVAGATWWRGAELQEFSDGQARQQILERVAPLLPSLTAQPTRGVWRGVRAVHAQDRRPLVGPVPGQIGLHVCGGFGSKGLLWGAFAADSLSEFILSDTPVPAWLGPRRLSRAHWQPGPPIQL